MPVVMLFVKRFQIEEYCLPEQLVNLFPDSFAYLVARKIAKEGTELYRNRKHEEIYSRDLENTVDNIASRVSAIYETEVEHINLNFDNENTYDR